MFAIEQNTLKGNSSTVGVEGNAVRRKGSGLKESWLWGLNWVRAGSLGPRK